MKIYRYFCRKCSPADVPPVVPPVGGAVYEQPVDSGNGKLMYGYIDYAQPLPEPLAAQFGLEAAPVNPIEKP